MCTGEPRSHYQYLFVCHRSCHNNVNNKHIRLRCYWDDLQDKRWDVGWRRITGVYISLVQPRPRLSLPPSLPRLFCSGQPLALNQLLVKKYMEIGCVVAMNVVVILLTSKLDMSRFLVELLNDPNVTITSWPNASLPAIVEPLDLELQTIGFYSDQVKAYLDAVIKQHANEIQSFLQDHWLMQGLMRIQIQLDALCYTWEDVNFDTALDTMTCIHHAIEQKLWKNDIVRLETMSESDAKKAYPAEIKCRIADEIELLECLAFNGPLQRCYRLHTNTIKKT